MAHTFPVAAVFSRSVVLLSTVLSTALVLSFSFQSSIGLYDEGFVLTDSWRILQGDVPHRDYWSTYPPGASLVLAAAFYLIEPTLLVARSVNALWFALLIGSAFTLIAKMQHRAVAAIAMGLSAWVVAASLYPSYPVIPALALCMFSVAIFLFGVARNSSALSGLAGCIAGSILLFRHDIAFYFLLATVLAMSIAARENPSVPQSRCGRALIRAFFVVSALCLTGMLAWCGFEAFFDQAILFPGTDMRDYRRLPMPGFFDFDASHPWQWMLAWAGPMLLTGGFVVSFTSGTWRKPERLGLILFSGLMSLILLLQARNRFGISHAAPSFLFLIPFVFSACETLSFSSWRSGQRAPSLICVTALVACLGYLLGSWNKHERVALPGCLVSGRIDLCMPVRQDQETVVRYLQSHLASTEPVFVGNRRHDRIFVNDASLYFLLKRPVAVRWNEMHPGVVTTREVQSEIVSNLEQKRVRYVVLSDMPDPGEPNLSSVSSGIFVLDDYLASRYLPVLDVGIYRIMERKGSDDE